MFKNAVTKEEQRYFMSWSWREENPNLLPENYELSLGRLKPLAKRFKEDLELLQETARQRY